MHSVTWLIPAPEHDGPSLALSSALRYLIACRDTIATDQDARLFGAARAQVKACGGTDTLIGEALR